MNLEDKMNRYSEDNNKTYNTEEDNFPETYNLEDDELGIDAHNDQSMEYHLPEDDEPEERSDEIAEEDDDDPLAWKGERKESKPTGFGLMFKIMSNPMEGWKQLKRSKFSVEKLSATLFYPLIVLAGLSNLTALFYDTGNETGEIITSVIFTCITFFFGYFTAILAGGVLLCKEAKEVLRTPFGKEFIMMGVSTLALFYILFRLVPMAAPIIAFFPIWTVYAMSKGIRMLKVPKEKEAKNIAFLAILVIGSPILWDWILSKMIPQ